MTLSEYNRTASKYTRMENTLQNLSSSLLLSRMLSHIDFTQRARYLPFASFAKSSKNNCKKRTHLHPISFAHTFLIGSQHSYAYIWIPIPAHNTTVQKCQTKWNSKQEKQKKRLFSRKKEKKQVRNYERCNQVKKLADFFTFLIRLILRNSTANTTESWYQLYTYSWAHIFLGSLPFSPSKQQITL